MRVEEKSISVEYFLFLVQAGISYDGYVKGIGHVSYHKTWGIPPFKSFDYNVTNNHFSSGGYILEITLVETENESNTIEYITSAVEKSNSGSYKKSVPNKHYQETTILDDAWRWARDHFEVRGEYELSFGAQVGGGIKKFGYAELNAESYVMQNLYFSYQDGIGEPIYQSQLDLDKPQVVTKSIAAAYYGGIEFSSRTETNGKKTYTFSIGAYCIGGEVNWNEDGIDDWFFGIDLTAKAAVFVGLMFNFKLGFSKND